MTENEIAKLFNCKTIYDIHNPEHNIILESGPATIANTISLEHLDKNQKDDNAISIHQIDDDYRLVTIGNFSDFHIYLIVTHTRFRIKENSVKFLGNGIFSAEIIFNENNNEIIKNIEFYSPFPTSMPIKEVKECKFGRDYNAFELSFDDREMVNQKICCDLTFITKYSIELDYKFPIKIEYIGMSEKNGRTAQQRLGKGHNKLQNILGLQNAKDSYEETSLILYRPGKFLNKSKIFKFEHIVKTLEASLISYFQTKKYNDHQLDFPKKKIGLTNILKKQKIRNILIELQSPDNTLLYSDNIEIAKNRHVFRIRMEK